MKKVSAHEKLRRDRLGRRRWRRRLRRVRIRRGDEHRLASLPSGFYPAPRFARKIVPPEHFDFDIDEAGLLKWLNRGFRESNKAIKAYHQRHRRVTRKPRVRSFYDFTRIRTMTPAAALVVAAYFDRHRQLAGMPIRVFDYEKWDPSVRQLLSQIGFFDLLEVRPPPLDASPIGGAGIERFASEQLLRPTEAGRLVDKLLGYILTAHPDLMSDAEATIMRTAKLFGALIEATENTRRHAYPQDTHSGYQVLPHWWLTGFADPAERRMTLIVYDQGISIPGSLASSRPSQWPGHDLVNRVIKRFSKGAFHQDDPISDHAKIRLAMKMGHTSTGQRHRGKGLPVVREAIQHCVYGRLHILSRSGGYLEETGRKAISWQLSSPMPGTLIIWDLRL